MSPVPVNRRVAEATRTVLKAIKVGVGNSRYSQLPPAILSRMGKTVVPVRVRKAPVTQTWRKLEIKNS